MQGTYYIGMDCGSTTVKTVVINKDMQIIYKKYERHHSRVRETALSQMSDVKRIVLPNARIHFALSGSAGLGLSGSSGLPFVQEVLRRKKHVVCSSREQMRSWSWAERTRKYFSCPAETKRE